MFEHEIDRSRVEGWRNDETADLDVEADLGPGVVMEENAADVADDLGEACERHGDAIAPCAIATPKGEAGGCEEGEKYDKEDVSAEGGIVAIYCGFEGARWSDVGAIYVLARGHDDKK